jgi:hypothetical protein
MQQTGLLLQTTYMESDKMIKKEFYGIREDGVYLYKTYSDLGYYIIAMENNAKYIEAIDVEDKYSEYMETEEVIDPKIIEARLELIQKEGKINGNNES